MKKWLPLGIIAIIVVFAEISYFFYLRASKNKQPKVNTNQVVESTGHINVVSQEKNDLEGRTVIYQSTPSAFSGTFGNTYTIGYFDKWESIPGSRDRYLILTDPLSSEKKLTYHVIFDQTTPPGFQYKIETQFGVEDLNLLKMEAKEGKIEGILPINSLKESSLQNLFKKGDVVVIYKILLNGVQKDYQDKDGYNYALFVIIRRFESQPVISNY